MKTLITRIALLLTITAFVGCASSTSDPTQYADKIKKGMTKDQVLQIAGKPNGRYSGDLLRSHHTGSSIVGDSEEVWSYNDGMMNVIPIVGLIRGARTNTLMVGFRSGRVTQVSQSSMGLW